MRSRKISTLAALACLLILAAPGAFAISEYAAWQQEADALYADEEWERAYSKYLKLAKKGDSFSQYRVSYMNLQAQGRSMDIVESFAWAVLAAQNGQEDMIKYRKAVAAMVPEKQQRKAERKVDYYMRKWGNIAIAQEAIDGAREQTRDCTGSRLGNRCDEVYAAQMPSFWGIQPGLGGGSNLDGGGAYSGAYSGTATEVGGGNGRDMAYYQALRDQIATLNQYIEEHAGRVEIGDFEVVEKEADDNS